MGDHYIPQFYLRGFTTGNTIWAHDRKLRNSFQSQPKTVANENEMYSEEIEKFLANSVEKPALPAIEKIRLQTRLGDEDRIALARYVLYLWRRVPEARNRVSATLPSVAESVRAALHKELDEEANGSPQLLDLANAKKDEVDQVIAKYTQNSPSEMWRSTLADGNMTNMMNGLLSMHWQFLVSEHGLLLTCDNPVYFHAHEGIGSPNSELTLPISDNVALWASRSINHNLKYIPTTKAAMKELNRRTAHNATRFVYSSRNEPWILPFVCKTKHSLTRLT